MRKVGARWIDGSILLAYILISLGMTYPLVAHLNTGVPGRQADARIFQWNNWWVRKALLNGLNPNYTDDIYYPSGVSLVGHNINWVSSTLAVPLSLAFGPTVAYNLTFLLTLWMSAFSMYLLVRYLVQRRDAAFVAGLVFGLFPYHLSGNWDGQMNLANTQWLPLVALFALRTLDRKRVSDAMLAGVFLALAALDCWHFAVFLGMWGVVFLAYSLVTSWHKWSGQAVGLYLLAGLVFGLITAPFLWPIVADAGRSTIGDALQYYEDAKSTDLLAFVIPGSDHPLLSQVVAPAYERFAHWRPAFLGYSALALAAYAAIVVRRKSLLWTLSGLLFAALALGTVLRVNGVEHPGIPLPLRSLMAIFPAFGLIRQASRFNVMVGLSLAVLVGLACADILSRLGRQAPTHHRGWLQYAVTCAASALVLFEYLAVPCPLLAAQVSPFYTQLSQEKEDLAIVELPLGLLSAGRSLYAQTFHGKKLVNGYVARAALDADAFVYSSPLLKALYLRMEPDPTLHDLPREIGVLALNDIRYVVIHKTPMPPMPAVEADVLASWRRLFGPNPRYEDEEIIVYETALAPDQSAAPILRFDDRLALLDVWGQRTQLLGHPFLTVDLTWRALAALEQTCECSLALRGATGTVAEIEDWLISPHYPTSRWPEGVVVDERYALPIDPALPGGDYRLSIRVRDASSGQELGTQELAIRVASESQPLAPVLADIPYPVDVTFGSRMWLLGYDQQEDGDRLVLHLYWHVLDTLSTNYKVFVHLIRISDGAIVAQQDTMPRGWSYPTSFWSRQETFIDRLDLDISAVEPGEYRLVLGVYKAEIGRLPATDADGHRFADDQVVMKEPVTLRRR